MANWRTRRYGRITGEEVERILSLFDAAWSERISWRKSDVGSEEWLESVSKISAIPSWIPLYREPLGNLIARLIVAAGVGSEFLEAAHSSAPASALLELAERLPDEPPTDPNALAVVFAMVGNLEAISHYSRTISDMFVAGENGELDALIQALSVDSHLICLPFFQAAMRLGQIHNDPSIAEEIFRAVRGPHRKRTEYPKLRWVEYLLRDQGAFEACTREEIYELCVENLGVYDPSGEKKDPKAALFSRFRTWQKEAGIQNPRFGFSAKRQ